MFLFILLFRFLQLHNFDSNTSYVLVYQVAPQYCSLFFRYSNTSYVLVYRSDLFSSNINSKFKYILCSYLSLSCRTGTLILTIQIHLMFLFIIIPSFLSNQSHTFKYILCSCLSQFIFWQDIKERHSNTSYVLVYPVLRLCGRCNQLFKYILCSCLSI